MTRAEIEELIARVAWGYTFDYEAVRGRVYPVRDWHQLDAHAQLFGRGLAATLYEHLREAGALDPKQYNS